SNRGLDERGAGAARRARHGGAPRAGLRRGRRGVGSRRGGDRGRRRALLSPPRLALRGRGAARARAPDDRARARGVRRARASGGADRQGPAPSKRGGVIDTGAAAFTGLIDLAAKGLGGTVLGASDDFFASAGNLI